VTLRLGGVACLVAIVGATGCGGDGELAAESPADVGRIDCSSTGLRVTPAVLARIDGVHVLVHASDQVYVTLEDSRGNGFAPARSPGGAANTLPLAPGGVKVRCHATDGSGSIFAGFTVEDPEELWASPELECTADAVKVYSDWTAETRGAAAPPVELTREHFADVLRPDDSVEAATYPESQTAVVRVIRDDRVVAAAEYRPAPGGWLRQSVEHCAGFGPD
jgi:hypothetical protein